MCMFYFSIPFWDVVVVTARDEFQKDIYEQQISLKKARKEIPLSVQWVFYMYMLKEIGLEDTIIVLCLGLQN